MKHSSAVLMTEFVTHDVKRFILSKPPAFDFVPGQGTKIVIDDPEWQKQDDHPFTPTSLRSDGVLEFMIKRYPDHAGVTDKLHRLEAGARLLLSDAFGTITYKGPGVFIAAGASISAVRIPLSSRARLP